MLYCEGARLVVSTHRELTLVKVALTLAAILECRCLILQRISRSRPVSAIPLLRAKLNGDNLDLVATGPWTAARAGELESLIDGAIKDTAKVRSVSVDMRGVNAFDTFGAWLLERLLRSETALARKSEVVGLRSEFASLLDRLHEVNRDAEPAKMKSPGLLSLFSDLGQAISVQAKELIPLANMIGAICVAATRVAVRPRSFRFTPAVHQLDRVGWTATPIIFLITFLIGCIIAQQGFFHFRKFGAENYVVDMIGILVLREIGVLLVAIMVAGRSGSSYTAELGSMKMREEIDALRTMGLDPVEVLILPRMCALILALPLLTFIGAMSGLFGGGVVAWLYDGMAPEIFIARLKEAITVTHFKVGMIKAPFMAIVIGAVACSEGLLVKGSAESLGLQTTTSVVKSIFLVIVLDGLFAIFFSSIGM
jgi:phospholipid/cholesterol/gamma-HCH transport system permease protein